MPTEQRACSSCKAVDKPLRESADGAWRCRLCKSLWLEKQHATPVRAVPPSVGRQGSFAYQEEKHGV